MHRVAPKSEILNDSQNDIATYDSFRFLLFMKTTPMTTTNALIGSKVEVYHIFDVAHFLSFTLPQTWTQTVEVLMLIRSTTHPL